MAIVRSGGLAALIFNPGTAWVSRGAVAVAESLPVPPRPVAEGAGEMEGHAEAVLEGEPAPPLDVGAPPLGEGVAEAGGEGDAGALGAGDTLPAPEGVTVLVGGAVAALRDTVDSADGVGAPLLEAPPPPLGESDTEAEAEAPSRGEGVSAAVGEPLPLAAAPAPAGAANTTPAASSSTPTPCPRPSATRSRAPVPP